MFVAHTNFEGVVLVASRTTHQLGRTFTLITILVSTAEEDAAIFIECTSFPSVNTLRIRSSYNTIITIQDHGGANLEAVDIRANVADNFAQTIRTVVIFEISVLEVIVEIGCGCKDRFLTAQGQGTEVTLQTEISVTSTFFGTSNTGISYVELEAVECLQTTVEVFSTTDPETGNATFQIPSGFAEFQRTIVIFLIGNFDGITDSTVKGCGVFCLGNAEHAGQNAQCNQ